MAATDAGDPGEEEHLLPAVPPLLGDSAIPPQLRHSPCGRKAASMEALVPVEGGEHGGSEDLIPAFPALGRKLPKPPSSVKAINMAAADRLQLGGIQDLLRASPTLLSNQMEEAHPMASMTAAPNHLSLCNGSKEFDIDWGDYLANDARMLTMGGVSVGPLLPLLVQGIECSTSQLASSSQPNHVDVERQTNDVDGDQESEYYLANPFDNEEYIGVDDENMYDVTVAITITTQPEAPTIIDEGDDNMDEAVVWWTLMAKLVGEVRPLLTQAWRWSKARLYMVLAPLSCMFRESYDRENEMMDIAGASLACIAPLALGKVMATQEP
ncbi:hypothetical protein ZWY2020_027207 [Hordeum vulgare]|nr:hypothetical protein ZWY2020_027207 [Hordeum vulgare]